MPCLFAQETVQGIEEPLQALLDGTVRSVEFSGGQVIVDAPRRGRVYLPGSFNPLHDGHRYSFTSRLPMVCYWHSMYHLLICDHCAKMCRQRATVSAVMHFRGLLAAALKTKGIDADGCFEFSVGNPDKGLISLEEAKKRVAQFVEAGLPLVVTQVSKACSTLCLSAISLNACSTLCLSAISLNAPSHVPNQDFLQSCGICKQLCEEASLLWIIVEDVSA